MLGRSWPLRGLMLVAAVAVCIVATVAPRAHGAVWVGVNDNAATLQDMAMVKAHHPEALGLRRVRTGLLWSVVQPSRNAWRWTFYDRLFALQARRGVRLVPVLIGTPTWAGEDAGTMPDAPAAFARFVAAVVARYGPGARFWRHRRNMAPRYFDLWNEPYLPIYATNGVDPGRYARLVRAAVTAGRAANPRARYLVEANTSWLDDSAWHDDWVQLMYRAVPDLTRYVDAVSTHPYCLAPFEWDPAGPWMRWQCRRIELIHDAFTAGGSDARVWVTEIGWSTCADTRKCVTADQQRWRLADFFELVKTYAYVPVVLLYSYADLPQVMVGDQPDQYGLSSPDGQPKPVWSLVEKLAGVLD